MSKLDEKNTDGQKRTQNATKEAELQRAIKAFYRMFPGRKWGKTIVDTVITEAAYENLLDRRDGKFFGGVPTTRLMNGTYIAHFDEQMAALMDVFMELFAAPGETLSDVLARWGKSN